MTEQTTSLETADKGFSESWLTLREPADHAARSRALTTELARWANGRKAISVLDLGAGTGSNFRYLAPHLGHEQQWTLVDNDQDLLMELPRLLAQWSCGVNATISNDSDCVHLQANEFSASVRCTIADLAATLRDLPFETADLLTASALLDLTSADWLDLLAELCIKHQCAALFALNYNGIIKWNPPFNHDNDIAELLNAHQLKNKGLGPALGPTAADYLVQKLTAAGRLVKTCQSDWQLSADQYELQHALLDGWIKAVFEQKSDDHLAMSAWQKKRIDVAREALSSLTVGHTDLFSL